MQTTPTHEEVSSPQPSDTVRESAPVVSDLYAYYVLAVLFVVTVFNFIDRQILAILLQPIKEDLKVSDTAMGFLTGFAFAAFHTFAGLPLARLADRWVRRSLIAISLATWSLMTAASGLARNFTDLAIARIGVGIGEAGGSPPSQSLLMDYFPPEKRATALSVFACGVYIGVGLGFWLGGWINDAFGWRAAFFVVGLPGVVMALVVRFTVRELPRGLSERQVVSIQQYSIRETWRFFASLTTGKRVSLAAALQAFAGYGIATWLPAFFIRVHHMTPGELGQWMSWIFAIGGALGTFAGGWIADRWVRREPRARAYISMIGVLLSIPFYVATLLLANQQLALLCTLPAITFASLWLGPSLAIIQDLVPPTMRATAAAVYLFIVTIIGLGAGPQIVGILNDWIGTPDAVRYSLLASVVVMSLSAGFFYWRAGKSLVRDLEAKTRL